MINRLSTDYQQIINRLSVDIRLTKFPCCYCLIPCPTEFLGLLDEQRYILYPCVDHRIWQHKEQIPTTYVWSYKCKITISPFTEPYYICSLSFTTFGIFPSTLLLHCPLSFIPGSCPPRM
ncbi:hypothetical protein PNOK_m000130 (mitochondrion) [Pyrrhoderma noxium]|uniref:Uncharacterized protein n=1 Tax=Pyrrhoderma noxium TaxID=2282107 RepID=A0A541AXR7_9AGAM|nr:hypothetical protein PNOK_m000130 [Pyrrhoderma noxium]